MSESRESDVTICKICGYMTTVQVGVGAAILSASTGTGFGSASTSFRTDRTRREYLCQAPGIEPLLDPVSGERCWRDDRTSQRSKFPRCKLINIMGHCPHYQKGKIL